MKQKAWIGIDPGINGAAALIHEYGEEVFDWPGDPGLAADKIEQWLLEYNIRLAALENVHAMPKQGVSSTFKFGQNLGQWQGILATLDIPYLMPGPREWQKGLVKPSDGKNPKARSLTVARRLFPDVELPRVADHNKADALLLAWWAKQQG